ncbi:MAG: iron(III) transport system substrate-binding protein [Alphaproteobacteria bacterium]|jgi:iron(III) transport system substrate-binding protein
MTQKMPTLNRWGLAAASLILALAIALPGTVAADMPASAKKAIKKYKLTPDLLANWEDEHKLPAGWLAAAKKEGEVKITGSWRPNQWERMVAPFKERYPFIKVNYWRGSRNTRVQAPLIAFREGRFITDIVTGIDSNIDQFKQANALADLSDVPNLKNIPVKISGNAKKWAGIRIRYYCMSYNTDRVKKADLPKRWDDLRTSPKFHDGKLGLWYGVASWLLPLWGEKGPAWGTRFIHDLYDEVKPQRRKEGATALVKLVGAGEFNGVLATAAYHVERLQKKGAPVALHCADTVMMTSSSVGLLKGNPHMHSAKMFLNWLLSKEGQLSQYRYSGAPPLHKDLQRREFIPFPDEIIGKTIAFRSPALLGQPLNDLFKVWRPRWDGSGGPKGKGR